MLSVCDYSPASRAGLAVGVFGKIGSSNCWFQRESAFSFKVLFSLHLLLLLHLFYFPPLLLMRPFSPSHTSILAFTTLTQLHGITHSTSQTNFNSFQIFNPMRHQGEEHWSCNIYAWVFNNQQLDVCFIKDLTCLCQISLIHHAYVV